MVGILLGLSAVIGGMAFIQYKRSERYLMEDLAAMDSRGRGLGTEECVDAVMEWSAHCRAMESLCLASVSRMMTHCLEGADRWEYCNALPVSTSDTHFGVAECRARGADMGKRKKVCAIVYRAIDAKCQRVATARKSGP